ncbi:MAG TPA: hypothetical protein VFY87_12745, partial [Geminicoccaceae bacterium]|nr:hypothetical protein [Geminicoccaceae bacterium]
EWVRLLRGSLAAAGVPEPRADALALLVVASIEGLLLVARAYRDCGPILAVAAELETVVAVAMPRRRRVA